MRKVESNSTLLHISITLITRIIVLLGSFVVSVLLARLLGPEGKGIVTSIMVVPLLLISLAELGLRQASAYFIGRKLYTVKEVISSLNFLWFVTSFFSVIIVFTAFTLQYTQYHPMLLLIAALTIPFNLIINYAKGVFQGIQRYAIINSFEVYKIILNFILVILLVWIFNLDVLGALLVQLIIGIIIALYSLRVIKKAYPIKFKINFNISKELLLKGVTFGLALFILQLNYRIDIVFLEYFVNSEAVGYYSVGTNMAELIWQVPAAVSLVLFGKSANSKSTKEAVNRSIMLMRFILPALFIFCIAFAVFSDPLIRLLYGEVYAPAALIIQLLLPGVFFMVIVKVLHSDLAGRGYPMYAIWVTTGPLIINILLNFLFIPRYGIEGAAITSSITYLISGILFIIVYVRRENLKIADVILLKKSDIYEAQKLVAKIKMRKS
ncbi:flippase [Shouchella miscanthi]|uniref:flippase n=1 Tax=Shouchella miscanthi TaxID=2598861 RepID=UPI0011AAAAF6|nr:flippase [Shouchella miscanthi]